MVQWAAGQRVTASRLSTSRPHAAADANLDMTTTLQDISGAELTFTTTRDDVDVDVTGVFDFQSVDAPTGEAQGKLDVDGSEQSGDAKWRTQVSGDRATVVQTWPVTLASAGSHTLKLQARTSSGDDYRALTHSSIKCIVEDAVG